MHDELRELVPLIPPGRVVTYGDLADDLGTGPRQIGRAMAGLGDDPNGQAVPWWRVVNARGELPPDLWERARREYAREGTPLIDSGERVAMRRARWAG
ncbi:MGMT family protein [Micrococcales bacterium 31B]|nr:MGMT family protein [Micrococcales bacterium 31B]